VADRHEGPCIQAAAHGAVSQLSRAFEKEESNPNNVSKNSFFHVQYPKDLSNHSVRIKSKQFQQESKRPSKGGLSKVRIVSTKFNPKNAIEPRQNPIE
jgi:stress-induced morphogen